MIANNYKENIEELIHKYEQRVLVELFPKINGKTVQPGALSIMRDLGNPASNHYMIENKVEDKSYIFNARFYSFVPETYKGEITPSEKAYKSYLFLKNQANIDVPKAVFLKDDAPGWLFTEFIPGQTLRGLLDKTDGEKNKVKLIEDKLFSVIANYQNKATNAAGRLSIEEKKELLWSRDIKSQAKDFLKMPGVDDNQLDSLVNNVYFPLLGESLMGASVCHGDLSPDNIILNEKTKIFNFIDPELKERNEFADMGCLISYLGDYESYWKGFAEDFKLLKTELEIKEEGLKTRPLKFQNDQVKRAAYFDLYANILHYSLRRISKMVRYGDRKDYDAQFKIVSRALDEWVSKPQEFGLNDEQGGLAKQLKEHIDNQINVLKPMIRVMS